MRTNTAPVHRHRDENVCRSVHPFLKRKQEGRVPRGWCEHIGLLIVANHPTVCPNDEYSDLTTARDKHCATHPARELSPARPSNPAWLLADEDAAQWWLAWYRHVM